MLVRMQQKQHRPQPRIIQPQRLHRAHRRLRLLQLGHPRAQAVEFPQQIRTLRRVRAIVACRVGRAARRRLRRPPGKAAFGFRLRELRVQRIRR